MLQPIRLAHRCLRVAGLIAAMVLNAGPATTNAAPADQASITIDNFTFTPAQITVPAGTTVTWINQDDIPHLVVDASNPQSMKSGPLDTDDRFSFTYAKPGTYPYFCGLHPHMQGTVIVQ